MANAGGGTSLGPNGRSHTFQHRLDGAWWISGSRGGRHKFEIRRRAGFMLIHKTLFMCRGGGTFLLGSQHDRSWFSANFGTLGLWQAQTDGPPASGAIGGEVNRPAAEFRPRRAGTGTETPIDDETKPIPASGPARIWEGDHGSESRPGIAGDEISRPFENAFRALPREVGCS